MQVIYPDIAESPLGTDPQIALYNAIANGFPALGLTMENSKIISIQPAATVEYPTMKRIVVLKGEDPNDWFEFFYLSLDIRNVLTSHPFNDEQLTHIATLTTSKAIVDYLGEVTGHPIRSEDFWCSDNSIDYCGGTEVPNFYLKAKYNAIWYCNALILNLWN